MDRRHLLVSTLSLVLMPSFAKASPVELPRIVPNPQKVGTGRLVVLMVPVLDATLYGPDGNWSSHQPFALHIEHLRHLDGDGTTRRIISEMRGVGFHDELKLAVWRRQLKAILPDVQPGETTMLGRAASGSTLFFHCEHLIGEIADPLFSETFFAICLGPKTSQPGLRKQLLGEA